jgi:hypothetical protein
VFGWSDAFATTQAAPSANAAPEPTENVHRPKPGTLEAGKYEAPPWAFYASASAVVVIALVYFIARLGILKRRKA